jgi:hypothetical protein
VDDPVFSPVLFAGGSFNSEKKLQITGIQEVF